MAIQNNSGNTLREKLDLAQNSNLAEKLAYLKFGAVLRSLPVHKSRLVPGTPSVYGVLTGNLGVSLPDWAKARVIHAAFARAGTGTLGDLVPVLAPSNTTAAATGIKIGPNGDLVTLNTDAYTDIDVLYTPWKGTIVERTLSVVPGTGVCALPAADTGVAGTGTAGVGLLLEAEVLAGTTLGTKRIQIPAAAAPATTLAGLNFARTQVFFAVADAVTLARVKYLVVPALDLDAALEATYSPLNGP